MKGAFIQLLTIFLFCVAFSVTAQPSWQWGKRGGSMGSGGDEKVIDMATDAKGNVYVLALNNPGIAQVDGHTGIGPHDRLSIVSWSCEGHFRWMKTLGGGASFTAKALRVDSLGGIYIAGGIINIASSAGMAYFDADTTLPYNYKSIYLVKYDTAGNFKWLKQPQPDTFTVNSGNNGIFGVYDMDVAPSGKVYLYSYLSPGLYDGGSYTIGTKGYYILKYNDSGLFQSSVALDMSTTNGGSVSNIDGQYNASQAHLAWDYPTGRFYLAGQYAADRGDMSFGTTIFAGTDYTPVMYLGAFDSTGNSLWVKQGNNDKLAVIPARPALDNMGNVYIGGATVPGNTFGGYTFNNTLGPHMVQFVVAVDGDGNNIWANNSSARDGAVSTGSIAYTNGIIGISAMYGGLLEWAGDTISAPLVSTGLVYILLARINAVTGNIIALDSIQTNSLNNIGTAITGDRNNNFYLGGYFADQLFVATDTLTKLTTGSNDWFIAKFGTTNCNCTIPVPDFTYAIGAGNAWTFTYTGTTPYTAISWDFGDGNAPSTTSNPTHAYTIPGSYTVCVTATNDCGSNTYCQTINTNGTGINTVPGFIGINFYPNPATQSITIDNARGGTQLEVYNAIGRLMLRTTLQGPKDRIDVRQLPSGSYLLRLTDKEGKQGASRFVKE